VAAVPHPGTAPQHLPARRRLPHAARCQHRPRHLHVHSADGRLPPVHVRLQAGWLALGAVALDLVIALIVTSLARERLGYRTWRALHWLAYACWPVAVAHGLGIGTDRSATWVIAMTIGCVACVGAAAAWRVLPWEHDEHPYYRARRASAAARWAVVPASAAPADHERTYGPLPVVGRRFIDVVDASGLTGRGGAGFPAGRKMRGVASGRGAKVVVANGCEGEPASSKDRLLLTRLPHLVLDGVEAAAMAVGAADAYVCMHQHDTELLASLEAACAERDDPGPVDR